MVNQNNTVSLSTNQSNGTFLFFGFDRKKSVLHRKTPRDLGEAVMASGKIQTYLKHPEAMSTATFWAFGAHNKTNGEKVMTLSFTAEQRWQHPRINST